MVGDEAGEYAEGAVVEEVDALGVEAGGGVELEDVVFPVEELVEGVGGEGEFEGVFDLVLYFFAERLQVVFDGGRLFLLLSVHYY